MSSMDCYKPKAVMCHDGHEMEVAEGLGQQRRSVAIVTSTAADYAENPDFRIVPDAVSRPDAVRLKDIVALERTVSRTNAISPSDTGLLLYTSGTTGVPKGVAIRHDSIVTNAHSLAQWVSLNQESRVLAIAPLFHITGFISNFAVSLVAQCALILHYRFEAQVVLNVIRRERPTFTVGAITAFNAPMQTDADAADFASFRSVFSGGAPIPPALSDRIWARLGIAIHNCYGMTETCSITHAAPIGADIPIDPISGALSIGIPFFGTQAIIIDDAGQCLPPGEIGEICMAGPQIMEKYWGKPDDSDAALAGGYMHSGDVGFMDSAGWFYIVDRKKDMINASGFKVWPREVEDILFAHPDVADVSVIGVPDAYRGETVLAFIVPSEGSNPEEGALFAHCRERLAPYKCPRLIRFLDAIPKGPTGKVQKPELRALAANALIGTVPS